MTPSQEGAQPTALSLLSHNKRRKEVERIDKKEGQ